MSQRVRVKLNNKGFEQLRRSPGVKKRLKAIADDIAAEAGEGYLASEYEGRSRSRASVITSNARAIVDNSKHHTLTRLLYAKKR